ncbi:MAG: glycoside hydrolase, partial [Chloroflexi bacterium]|nr:glycoside hydrolase [Chloroflexota bacterium]
MARRGTGQGLALAPSKQSGQRSPRHIVTLDRSWLLLPVSESKPEYSPQDPWLEVKVPGHWQEYPGLEFYSGKVVYRKEFSLRKKPGSRYWLILPGIFYWSHVRLNGEKLGAHEGYFTPQEYEVTDFLRDRNTLLVEVDCPSEDYPNHQRMLLGAFSVGELIDPKTNPGGIWLAPEIRETGPVYIQGAMLQTGQVFIKEALFQTESISLEKAEVKAGIYIEASFSMEAELRIAFIPSNFHGNRQIFSQKISLHPGSNEFQNPMEVTDPHLWWTHDLGSPDLYRVGVEVRQGVMVMDRWQGFFGIRTFEMREWIGYLNGKRIFLKGSNYPPADTRLARMDFPAYQRDLELAKAANLNILRVKAHVEHPAFYRAADEAGVLIWQDFPLQGGYSREVLPSALEQAAGMVRLLYNHSAVAIWCMHNQPTANRAQNQSQLWGRTFFSRFYNWNRDVLASRLQKLVAGLDSSRFVVRSSGEQPFPFLRQGTDSQFYFGWDAKQGPLSRFQDLIQKHQRRILFVTGFGAQSFPNYEMAIRFLGPELSRVDEKDLEERHGLQRKNMARWIKTGKMKNLEELITATQEYQIKVHQYYIDRLRLRKYRPTGGIIIDCFLDPYPAIGFSVVDYWRVPKKSYWALQQSFHPQYVFILLDAEPYRVGQEVRLPIYIVNDSQQDFGAVAVTVQVLEDDAASGVKASFIGNLG